MSIAELSVETRAKKNVTIVRSIAIVKGEGRIDLNIFSNLLANVISRMEDRLLQFDCFQILVYQNHQLFLQYENRSFSQFSKRPLK